jgi:hypothetical protein
VASDPPLDLALQPLHGPARALQQWLTTFHLVLVALDPYTDESAWLLETAGRILTRFQEADCRIAWLVTADADDCRRFLGPWSQEILTFPDPERLAVKAFGVERLPALLHVAMDGTLLGAAEGWQPAEWRAVTDRLARLMSWTAPVVPEPRDPGPFEGSPALG